MLSNRENNTLILHAINGGTVDQVKENYKAQFESILTVINEAK